MEIRGRSSMSESWNELIVRLGPYAERFKNDESAETGHAFWCQRHRRDTDAPVATVATCPALALDRGYSKVRSSTVTGNFRGRNLFGKTCLQRQGSFAMTSCCRVSMDHCGSTNLRPRGRGFDLDWIAVWTAAMAASHRCGRAVSRFCRDDHATSLARAERPGGHHRADRDRRGPSAESTGERGLQFTDPGRNRRRAHVERPHPVPLPACARPP